MYKVLFGVLAFMSACLSGVYAGGDIDSKSKALAHYIMAFSHDLNGQPTDALKEYEQSASFESEEPLPHLRLGAYYARSGQLDLSVRELKRVLSLEAQNQQAHYLLALVYSTQKKYDLAASEYEAILKSAAQDEPTNYEIYLYLAQLYFSQGQYEKAKPQFEKILTLQADNVSATYYLGASYLEMHQRGKARDYFKKTLALDKDHDGALNSLAYMYAEDNVELDDAIKMARRAIAIDPSNGAYYDTLGWSLFKKGMNAESLMALQKAELYTQDPVLYEHIGDVYKAVNEFALARKFWARALELDTNQPHIKAKIEELGKTRAQAKTPVQSVRE
jgi:Tfp pilus assembly protein PilF